MPKRPVETTSAMRFVVPTREDQESQRCVGYVPAHIDAPRSEVALVAWMKPAAFLRLVDPHFTPDPSRLAYLRAQAAAGHCFAPLMVWPDKGLLHSRLAGRPGILNHEGRHRAYLAHQLKVARVPVLIMRATPEHWSRKRRPR